MIISWIITLFAGMASFLIGLLPNVDNGIITKEAEVMIYGYEHFMTLAYYYLPVDTIQFWVQATISLVIVLVGLQLLGRIILMLTGGAVRLPWI